MAGKIEAMPTGVLIDLQTGEISMEWRDFLEEVVFGQSDRSIGTVLSGVNTALAQVSGITEGSEESASEGLMGDFTVTASPTATLKTGTGTVVSDSVTISISGGTAPYSIAYSSVGLAPFTAAGPAALVSDGDISASWSREVASSSYYSGQQKVTVTDSAGSPLMAEVIVELTMYDPAIIAPDGLGIGAG